MSQEYQNYRVIIIDDVSTDRSVELIKEFITLSPSPEKFSVIKNEKRKFAMANHYMAASEHCKEH